MGKRRVVVTGMGLVSCFGHDLDTFYQQLLEGNSGVTTVPSLLEADLPVHFGGFVSSFPYDKYLDKKQARRVDPYMKYAIVAGKRALEHAGLFQTDQAEKLDRTRCGIVIGSGIGGLDTLVQNVNAYAQRGYKKVSPFFIPYTIVNMAGATLAMDLGFMGPNYAITTACATSNYSMIAAADHIRKGECDVMLTGGSEGSLLPVGVAGFCACKALADLPEDNTFPTHASRPFDKSRHGFVMGDGSGVLVLEELEHAKRRGATIYAEYLGGATSCDAHHMTEPHPEGKGVALAIAKTLEDAACTPADVNYINAHATSTPVGDEAEIRGLQTVFSSPEKIYINATKSMTGHTLGAAGGLEAIATIMAMQTGFIHPTINLKDPIDGLGFQAPTSKHALEIRVALSNSFGFGGHNSVIALAPYAV